MGDGDDPVEGVGDCPEVEAKFKEVFVCFVGDGKGPDVGGREGPGIGAKVGEGACY